jgi:CRP-like cAMP-binding protein
MNDRLSTFIGLLVSSRHATTEGRVATALVNLFNPALYARDSFVRISQSELAMLAGTSRQRTNDALRTLHEMGLVQARRNGIDVLDLERLWAVTSAQ